MLTCNFSSIHLTNLLLTFIAGICLHINIVYSIALIIASLLISFQYNHNYVTLILLFCSFICGSQRYLYNRQIYTSHGNLINKKCCVTGIIKHISEQNTENNQICITLQLESINFGKFEHILQKTIYIFTSTHGVHDLEMYQKVKFFDLILKQPTSISYQNYLIKEGAWAIAHPTKIKYSIVALPHTYQTYISFYMQKILCKMQLVSELTQHLFESIFYGIKIKKNTYFLAKKQFQYWGISHYLARSGLHLMVLIGILSFLFSYIPISLRFKSCCISFLLCIYYCMTNFSVSFLRAFCMYILYTVCKHLYLPTNNVHILLITAFIILIINPHQILFLDFQLSFWITLIILFFFQSLQNLKTVAS